MALKQTNLEARGSDPVNLAEIRKQIAVMHAHTLDPMNKKLAME